MPGPQDVRASNPEPLGGVEVLAADDLGEVLELITACPDAPRWSFDAWRSFLAPQSTGSSPGRCLLGARSLGPALVGVSAFAVLEDVSELELVLVHPAWRRRGIGRRLTAGWMARSREQGARTALLEVRAGNQAAQRLYQQLGFEVQGRRPGYYQHPVEDAVLMAAGLASKHDKLT